MEQEIITKLRPGQTVRVHQKIKEGEKERLQVFEGLVIAQRHGQGQSATFTVRKTTDGVGIERIFPLHSPIIAKLEILRQSKVRRSKLYHVRGKQIRPLKESRKA